MDSAHRIFDKYPLSCYTQLRKHKNLTVSAIMLRQFLDAENEFASGNFKKPRQVTSAGVFLYLSTLPAIGGRYYF